MDADEEDTDEEEETEEEDSEEPPTAAEVVQAGLQRGDLSDENITIDRREIDEVEEQLVQDYARDGCNAITVRRNLHVVRQSQSIDTEAFETTWQTSHTTSWIL